MSLDLSRGSLDGGPDCLYALTDGQGNVSAIADAAGVAVERYFHTPDGGVAIKDGVWGADRNISAYGWRVMWHGGRWDSGGVAESGWPYGYGDHYLNGAEWDQIMGGNLAHDPNVYWGRQMAIVVPSVSPIGEAIASVVMNRYVSGALQMIQGGVEIVLGGAASKTGIGMILGIPLIAHGLDTFQAGLRTFAGEDNVNTLTSQKISEFAQGLGASKSTADTIGAWGDVGIGLVGSVGAMWRIGAVGRAAEQAALRARVMANIAESQAARQASRFGVYAAREAAVMRYASGEAQVGRTVANSTRGWRVGDPINNLTAKGDVPSWGAVRQRIWKNEAFYNAKKYSAENLARMKRGLAEQRFNPDTGLWESKQLHHAPPQAEGGLFDVTPMWPGEHARIHYGG